jgi:predicted transcriptional regulator
MKVDEIMTKKLAIIDADATIYDAIESMIDKRMVVACETRDEKDAHCVSLYET